jgi:very-short-patch-repair endonuclease
VDGIPVTAPARTLADLATVVDSRTLEQAVAGAERADLITRDELRTLVDRRRGRPGVALLRTVVCREGGAAFTRSEAEARLLALIRGTPLPTPQVNAVVLGREVDFFWAEAAVVVEVDGYAFHRSRHSFEGDRQRDALFAAHGIRVLRFTWDQIVHHERSTLATVAQVLARPGAN